MNRLINSVRQQNFLWHHGKKRGNHSFAGFTLGIARKLLKIQSSQAFENARRASDSVLVKVETQPIAPKERRMIRRKCPHSFARTKHAFSSPGRNAHVPQDPQFRRDRLRYLQFSASPV